MSCRIPDFIPVSKLEESNKQNGNQIDVHIDYKQLNKRNNQSKAKPATETFSGKDKSYEIVDKDYFWAPGEKENYQEDELQRFSRSIIRIVPNFSPRKSHQ